MKTNSYPLIFKVNVVKCHKTKKYTVKKLLSIFNISRSSLYNWIKLYDNNELSEKQKYTKTSKYTIDIKDYICKYVLKKINFDCNKLIRLINKNFNIDSKKSKIYEILKESNITRKRIKIKTKICNKLEITKKKKDLAKKIKTIKKENIISIDESSFDTHINAHYGWNIKGASIEVQKVKQRKRFSIISAISIKKIIHTTIVKDSINAEIFTEFIKEVVSRINSKKVLFMDNARIHHSKIFTAYSGTIRNKILYNVPYCSELNPIEMVFSKVKSIVHKRKTNENVEYLKRNIKYGFRKITGHDLKGYYEKSLKF